MKRLLTLTASWALLTLAVCGDPAGGGAARAEAAVDTVAGVERLSYSAEPTGELGWVMDTAAVIGDAFAEDAYQFDQVLAERVAGDAAGNLYVLDASGHRILKYGPDGEHLATYGRQGEGPGELSQPLGMTIGPGDTIWVTDFSNTRLTGFPQDGGEPRLVPLPEGAGVPGLRLAIRDDGILMLFRPLFNFRRGPGGGMRMSRGDGDDEGPRRLPLLRVDPSLQPLDTLWRTLEPPMDMVQLESGQQVMITMMAREFWPEFQWQSFSDGGIVLSDTAAYVLHLLDPDGTPRRVIRREPAPRAAMESDRERVRQRLREESEEGVGIRIGGSGPDNATRRRMLEQRLEKMTFADVIPQVVRLRVDPSDRIWVGVAEEAPDSVSRIDLYDREGWLLGELRSVPMPDVFLGPNRIGVLGRDELDVQQIVLLDLHAEADAARADDQSSTPTALMFTNSSIPSRLSSRP